MGYPSLPAGMKAPFFDARFHPIVCRRPFSASELNGADGIIGDVGASLGVGYGVVEITAHRGFIPDFRGQRTFVRNLGLGIGATAAMGVWRHLWGKET